MPPMLSGKTRTRNMLRWGSDCIQCSRRRVKCGKEHPRCSHCLNQDIVCHYMPSTLMTWKYSRSYSSPVRSSMDSFPSIAVVDSAARSQNRRSPGPDAAKENLNIHDLELMVQWCTRTYRSISYNNDVEGVWQTVVPREATQHPALMHGILALSALHLASTIGGSMTERYLQTARTHQDLAFAGFKRSFKDLNQSNCNAAFALCSLMTISSLAFPLTAGPNDKDTALDDLCHAFEVARDSMDILAEVADWIENSELRPLLGKDDSGPKMPDTSRLTIMSLSMMNSRLASRRPEHEKDIYEATITQLGESLEKLAQGREASIVAFQWMYRIPSSFLDLVKERQPFSLVILAHYAVILHFMRSRWWVGEWGARVIRQIGQLLDSQWRQSISWVLDATGYYIPPA